MRFHSVLCALCVLCGNFSAAEPAIPKLEPVPWEKAFAPNGASDSPLLRINPFLSYDQIKQPASAAPSASPLRAMSDDFNDGQQWVTPGVRVDGLASQNGGLLVDWRQQVSNPDSASRPRVDREQTLAMLKFDYESFFWQAGQTRTASYEDDSFNRVPHSWLDETDVRVGRRIKAATITFDYRKRSWDDGDDNPLSRYDGGATLSYKIKDWMQPFAGYGMSVNGRSDPYYHPRQIPFNMAEYESYQTGLKGAWNRQLDWSGWVEMKDMLQQEEFFARTPRLPQTADRLGVHSAVSWQVLPQRTGLHLQWDREAESGGPEKAETWGLGLAHRWSDRWSTQFDHAFGQQLQPTGPHMRLTRDTIATQYQVQQRASLVWRLDQEDKGSGLPANEGGSGPAGVDRSVRMEMKIKW